MNSRMDKYVTNTSVKRRTSKNEKLYDEVSDMNIDYVNINVDNAVELMPDSNKSSTREDYHRQRELNKILPKNKESRREIYQEQELEEDRIYDINEILKLARTNKLFEDTEKKRLINTEYNILTKLDLKDIQNDQMKKEDLRNLIDSVYGPSKRENKNDYQRYDDDLFKDLLDDGNDLKDELRFKEELTKELVEKNNTGISLDDVKTFIDQEIIKEENLQKTMLEEDNTDVEDDAPVKEVVNDEKDEDEYVFEIKEGKGLLITIIIISILILLVIGFFVYEYFFGI